MRKESTTIARAFLKGRAAKQARTTTDGQAVYLHRNRIAWRDQMGDIHMTLCGWPTAITRDRLNAICEDLIGYRPFHQKRGVQFFNDNEIGVREEIVVHTLEVTNGNE